jgi:phosphoglycolate phosphatase
MQRFLRHDTNRRASYAAAGAGEQRRAAPMYKLAVFDCDGTLVDSQHHIVAAMTSAFTANNVPVPHRTQLVRHIGLSVTEAMTSLAGSRDADLVARLAKSYRAAVSEMRNAAQWPDPMFPGAREALENLSRRTGISLGLATGKSRRGVYLFLEREDLRHIFATVQTADDAPSKPHPAMLAQAMAAVGVQPHETVMIGDTSFDMAMAHAAGVRGIGVGWGYHGPDELIRAGASDTVLDFEALLNLLSPVRASAVA